MQGSGNRDQRTEIREQGPGIREQGSGNRGQGTGVRGQGSCGGDGIVISRVQACVHSNSSFARLRGLAIDDVALVPRLAPGATVFCPLKRARKDAGGWICGFRPVRQSTTKGWIAGLRGEAHRPTPTLSSKHDERMDRRATGRGAPPDSDPFVKARRKDGVRGVPASQVSEARPGAPIFVRDRARFYFTETLGSTERPGRSSWLGSSLARSLKSMRTGTRWTTFT